MGSFGAIPRGWLGFGFCFVSGLRRTFLRLGMWVGSLLGPPRSNLQHAANKCV